MWRALEARYECMNAAAARSKTEQALGLSCAPGWRRYFAVWSSLQRESL